MGFILRYSGFKTTFITVPIVEKFLTKRGYSITDLIPSKFIWYEHLLFNWIDKNRDGVPDKDLGKDFEVIFYEIIERWVDKKEIGCGAEVEFLKQNFITKFKQTLGKRKEKFGIGGVVLKKTPKF